MTRVAIALGANLAEPEEQIHRAVSLLQEAGLENIVVAPCLKSKPVDCVPGTPDFTNTVLTADWNGTPHELLAVTQGIEHALGRPDVHSSHEARIIDLDIILFGNQRVSTPDLVIPHPRMHLRSFVLIPLEQIEPDWKQSFQIPNFSF